MVLLRMKENHDHQVNVEIRLAPKQAPTFHRSYGPTANAKSRHVYPRITQALTFDTSVPKPPTNLLHDLMIAG
jgi:hypothetical protein